MKTKNKSEIEKIVENVVKIISIVSKNEMEKYHQDQLKKLNEKYIQDYRKIERNYKEEFQIISQPHSPSWGDDLLS